MLRRSISRVGVLAGACFLAIAPFFRWGTPSGHDFEFHLNSWMEVLGQWKYGVVYPRWAALAQWGYGEPRFLFYPPASWTLGAVLGAILPWRIVPGAYCWIVLTLAGAAMYHVARRWLQPRDALFAAVFYALNPYHLLIVYWRSAYAELLAAPLLPLLLLCVLRLNDPGPRPTLWLSLVLAVAWLTNVPAALMIQYSAIGLVLLLAVRELGLRRSWDPRVWRPLLRTALAMLLGAGLASFYLLPASLEQRWINLQQVLSPGVRPQDNFLFTFLADPDHNRFNLLVSTIALVEIVALACAVWLSRRPSLSLARESRPAQSGDHSITARFGSIGERSWLVLSAWGTCSALVMLPVSNLLWEHLPKFRYVQLPFRWLLCLNAALALLLTVAVKGWARRAAAASLLLAALIIAGYRTQPPWWAVTGDFYEMTDAMGNGTGYEGVDEYVPAGADASDLNKNLPRVSDQNGVAVHATIVTWRQTEKHFTVHSAAAQDLTVRLFSYPAWEVVVNGRSAATKQTDDTRLIVIPVADGDSDIHIYFRRTPDRRIGNAISFMSLIIFLGGWIKTWRGQEKSERAVRHQILLATSNPGKLRDFAGAAAPFAVTIANIPNFSSLPQVIEDGATFEENALKKAEGYSRAVPGELVLADDSGLEIDALGGAPGVHSARFAAHDLQKNEPHAAQCNSDDEANNARVLRELKGIPESERTARFVCVLAAARDGQTLRTFRGTAEGVILDSPLGKNGFGYDPLFYFPKINKTFAELSAEEKARYSHRGMAFRAFLEWCQEALDKN
ncbi:MAG: RdgB/HAM1 family non-canonical purine NTP pyrophosphatase [Terriglobales bacterium]